MCLFEQVDASLLASLRSPDLVKEDDKPKKETKTAKATVHPKSRTATMVMRLFLYLLNTMNGIPNKKMKERILYIY